jgi:predicted type IV restriction endonuclease
VARLRPEREEFVMVDATPASSKVPTAPKWEQDAREAIKVAIRRFAKPLQEIVARDANEGDTRLIVTDFLCDGLGYDKFEDLTTEFAVKGEFADYGVRIDKQLVAFIEVKRVTQNLNVRHLRQVETYAVKEGLQWIILTNGQVWQAYHVYAKTGQQVATHLALEVDLLGDAPMAHKVDGLFYLHHAALKRNLIDDLWKRKAATSAGSLAEVLLTEPVLDAVRREIRRTSGYNPDTDELARVVRSGVIRPELLPN